VKPTQEPHLQVVTFTDPGRGGRVNEDRFKINAYHLSENEDIPVLLAVVADGVGGHQAGEIAAEIAVDTVDRIISESDPEEPAWILKKALLEANHSITSRAEKELDKEGMGSTITCALVIDSSLYIASMGDSRIYLIRDGQIRQLTMDHTWVQEAIDSGVIQIDEARNHPRRHLIRSFLGSSDPIQPDLRLFLSNRETDEQAEANQGLPLIPQDLVLLCTDGLTDLVTDEEIFKEIERQSDQRQALEELGQLAMERGGYDNITAVLLQFPGEELYLT